MSAVPVLIPHKKVSLISPKKPARPSPPEKPVVVPTSKEIITNMNVKLSAAKPPIPMPQDSSPEVVKVKEPKVPKPKRPFMHISLNAEMKNGELSHFSYKIKEKRAPRSADPRKRNVIKRNLT